MHFHHNALLVTPSRNCAWPGNGDRWLAVLVVAHYTVFSYSAIAWKISGVGVVAAGRLHEANIEK
jgi:hypothetical protein